MEIRPRHQAKRRIPDILHSSFNPSPVRFIQGPLIPGHPVGNAKLNEPIQIDTESYGLKNLQQRLKLFYGDNCGLSVGKNGEKGLSIQIVLLKMTCEEYEQGK
jgi:hypothetical protein